MKRVTATILGLALAIALLATPRHTVEAGAKASPPQSSAFGMTLPEWMQQYFTWSIAGGSGPDHVGHVKFLPLPVGNPNGGSFTYADPGVLLGHLDFTMEPGTPLVFPVTVWYGEVYEPSLGFPPDPTIPGSLFTDDPRNPIRVYVDGKPVMDSTLASVRPFYFDPVPLDVVYSEPTSYGSIKAIFVQGIGFVLPPLSVGVHTVTLESGLRIPPDPSILNLTLNPSGVGVKYLNSWTITVAPGKK
jgi:hypothetical protein